MVKSKQATPDEVLGISTLTTNLKQQHPRSEVVSICFFISSAGWCSLIHSIPLLWFFAPKPQRPTTHPTHLQDWSVPLGRRFRALSTSGVTADASESPAMGVAAERVDGTSPWRWFKGSSGFLEGGEGGFPPERLCFLPN